MVPNGPAAAAKSINSKNQIITPEPKSKKRVLNLN